MENKPSGHFGTERARTTAHKHSEARRCPDDVKFTLKFIFACGTSAAETQIHISTKRLRISFMAFSLMQTSNGFVSGRHSFMYSICTILPKVLAPLLMKGLSTLVISMSANLNV